MSELMNEILYGYRLDDLDGLCFYKDGEADWNISVTDVSEYPIALLASKMPGAVPSRSEIRAWLNSERIRRIKEMFVALMDAVPNQRRMVIRDQVEHLPYWFAALSSLLPYETACTISFCAYRFKISIASAKENLFVLHGLPASHEQGVEKSTDAIDLSTWYGQSTIFDMIKHAFTPLDERPLIVELVDTLAAAEDSNLSSFHHFLRQIGYFECNRKLDGAYQLFLFASGNWRLRDISEWKQIDAAFRFATEHLDSDALTMIYTNLASDLLDISRSRNADELEALLAFLFRYVAEQGHRSEVMQLALDMVVQFLPDFLFQQTTWNEAQVNATEEKLTRYFSETEEREWLADWWISTEAGQKIAPRLVESASAPLHLYVLKKMEEGIKRHAVSLIGEIRTAEAESRTETSLTYTLFASLDKFETKDADKLLQRVLVRLAAEPDELISFFHWLQDRYPGDGDDLHPMLQSFVHDLIATIWQKADMNRLTQVFEHLILSQKFAYVSRQILALARGKQGTEVFRYWGREVRTLNRGYDESQSASVIIKYLEMQKLELDPKPYRAELSYCLENYLDRMQEDSKTKDLVASFEAGLTVQSAAALEPIFLRDLHRYKLQQKLSHRPDRINLALLMHLLELESELSSEGLKQICADIGELNLNGMQPEEWREHWNAVLDRAVPLLDNHEVFSSLFGIVRLQQMAALHRQTLERVVAHWKTSKQMVQIIAYFEIFKKTGEVHDHDRSAHEQWQMVWTDVLAELEPGLLQRLTSSIRQKDVKLNEAWQALLAVMKERHPGGIKGVLKKWFGS